MAKEKYETYIDGLDSLFYGGLYIKGSRKARKEASNDQEASNVTRKDLLLLARGVHGVNKVHLAMQICEGIYLSLKKEEKSGVSLDSDLKKEEKSWVSLVSESEDKKKDILFVSLNKDTEKLKDTYVGFYIQRLIRGFQRGYQSKQEYISGGEEPDNRFFKDEFSKLFILPEGADIDKILRDIKNGSVCYNDRLQQLCYSGGAEYMGGQIALGCKDLIVEFIGSDKDAVFNNGLGKSSYDHFSQLLMYLADKVRKINDSEKQPYKCIMIDGLSCLSEEELKKCDFSTLASFLRDLCTIGVITADEKLQPPAIPVDIVIDMAIREEHNPECVQYALKISKCLYQKHVYGWHSYKMRRIGIEVIPSLHFQMNSRFHMDDAVLEATFGIEEVPPAYWINEGKTGDAGSYKDLDTGCLYAISVNRIDDGKYLFPKIKSLCDAGKSKNEDKPHHFLFIDFSRNRTEFYNNYFNNFYRLVEDKVFNRIHLFNFFSGYIHDDDFLYTIEKQVKALYHKNKLYSSSENETMDLEDYHQLHLVIGDINNINFGYPCLNKDRLLFPALSIFTKKHHMTNFVYTSANWEISILDTEKELYQQLKVIAKMMY